MKVFFRLDVVYLNKNEWIIGIFQENFYMIFLQDISDTTKLQKWV